MLLQAAYVYSYLDAFGCLLFLFAYFWLYVFERSESADIDRRVISASDYSVTVTGIPAVSEALVSHRVMLCTQW